MKYLLSTFILISQTVATIAVANAAPLYVVDVQKIIESSIAGKAARENLQGEIKKSESKVVIKRAEIDRLRADLQKQGDVLSPDARQQRSVVIRDKARDLEKLVGDEQDELKRKSNTAMDDLVKKVEATIAKLSNEMGYQIVLQKDPRLVLFVAPEFDLTNDVVKRIDAEKLK